MPHKRPYSQTGTSLKPWILTALVILAVAAIVTTLELTNTTHIFHSSKITRTPHTSGQNTKGETGPGTPPSAGTNQNGRAGDTTNGTKGQGDSPAGQDTVLVAPTGTFVSAHHISLSVNPAVQSTCQTTARAICQIIFTKDGTTKSLSATAADDGGAAYWTWRPADLGLTAGTWHIQAKATLNAGVQTADDGLALEVTP